MKIRVGVAGVGHRGLGLTRILAAMEDVALVALADFEQQCYRQCTTSASEERARCLLEVAHLDEMRLCP